MFPKAPASLNRFGQQPMWFGDRDSLDYRQDIEQSKSGGWISQISSPGLTFSIINRRSLPEFYC